MKINKNFRIAKKIIAFAVVLLVLLTPSLKTYAIDASHVKVGVAEQGKCFSTTYETFNYPAFLFKHPEIGFCDKETAWAYYEMYCKPAGELAPCNLKAYMSYKEFDVDYFLTVNGLDRGSATDEEIFTYFCDTYPAYFWAAKGTTEHATALIIAYQDFWGYNAAMNEASELEVILNFYALPSLVTEYLNVNAYEQPDIWNYITTIDGPMLYGLANCQGYANLFLFLMDMGGYPCQTVYSSDHMWDEVLYNGSWYAIDTCWADKVYDHISAVNKWFMFTY